MFWSCKKLPWSILLSIPYTAWQQLSRDSSKFPALLGDSGDWTWDHLLVYQHSLPLTNSSSRAHRIGRSALSPNSRDPSAERTSTSLMLRYSHTTLHIPGIVNTCVILMFIICRCMQTHLNNKSIVKCNFLHWWDRGCLKESIKLCYHSKIFVSYLRY